MKVTFCAVNIGLVTWNSILSVGSTHDDAGTSSGRGGRGRRRGRILTKYK
jgi:hypothetical protein